MFERILVPLDGSRFSGGALPYAVEVAKRFGGEVMLLHVINPTPVVTPSAGLADSPSAIQLIIQSAEEQDRRNVARANRYLKEKVREVTTHGINTSYHVVMGDPAEAIISFCRKESVGLVVMTTSGKGGLRRAFLGSVTDKVIREPGFPVLAIRPQGRRKK